MVRWNAVPEGGNGMRDTRSSMLVGVRRQRRPGEEKGAGNKEKGKRAGDRRPETGGRGGANGESRKANSGQPKADSRGWTRRREQGTGRREKAIRGAMR